MRLMKIISIVFIMLLSLGLLYLTVVATSEPTYSSNQSITATPTNTPTASPTVTATVSPTPCPVATPELLRVEPVTSPTELLTQTVNIYAGNHEWVTVDTGYEVFTATSNVPEVDVEIDLLLNQTHELEASSRVRVVDHGGCIYGGYTLHQRFDRHGQLLKIVQQSEAQYLPIIISQ